MALLPRVRHASVLPTPYRLLFVLIEVSFPKSSYYIACSIGTVHRDVLNQLTANSFMQPLIIWGALASIIAAPANHFHSLAPHSSAGRFFAPSPGHASCTQPAAWNTPQLRAMLYQFMGALAFSAIIEPLALYVAIYRLENARDAERVVTAVLVAFAAFDVLHSAATIAVTGLPAVLPSSIHNPTASFHLEAAINFWVPLVWLGIRSCWFLGIRRESNSKLKH